jgi:hypothetical protein
MAASLAASCHETITTRKKLREITVANRAARPCCKKGRRPTDEPGWLDRDR